MSVVQAVKGMFDNLLELQTPDEVVVRATCIHCNRFDTSLVECVPEAGEFLLSDDCEAELVKWKACWERMALMDVYYFPVWEEEVHAQLQPLFKELQMIFLAYTRSISETSAADALEMSLEEFQDLVQDTEMETDDYRFDVMSNQFMKANAVNSMQVRVRVRVRVSSSQQPAVNSMQPEPQLQLQP